MAAVTASYRPVPSTALPTALADTVEQRDWRVVGFDADPALDVQPTAAAVAEELRQRGTSVLLASTEDWWRPASLRLEYGTDPTSALSGWYDDNALTRELVRPLRSGDPVLTRFWDPVRDRSFRDTPQPVRPGTVLLLTGPFLQYLFLELDATIRFSVSERTLGRRLPADRAWWLAAHRTYREACPDAGADLLVAWDHPDRPAVWAR